VSATEQPNNKADNKQKNYRGEPLKFSQFLLPSLNFAKRAWVAPILISPPGTAKLYHFTLKSLILFFDNMI
jgi:hypothetical protein